jgi:hypothetical protein
LGTPCKGYRCRTAWIGSSYESLNSSTHSHSKFEAPPLDAWRIAWSSAESVRVYVYREAAGAGVRLPPVNPRKLLRNFSFRPNLLYFEANFARTLSGANLCPVSLTMWARVAMRRVAFFFVWCVSVQSPFLKPARRWSGGCPRRGRWGIEGAGEHELLDRQRHAAAAHPRCMPAPPPSSLRARPRPATPTAAAAAGVARRRLAFTDDEQSEPGQHRDGRRSVSGSPPCARAHAPF